MEQYPATTDSSKQQRSVPAELPDRCPYCGSLVNHAFYFCVSCGTPYQSVNNVIAPVYVRKLTDEQRINLKAPRIWTIFWIYMIVVLTTAMINLMVFGEGRADLLVYFNSLVITITTCILGGIYWKSLASQFKSSGFLSPWAWAAIGLLPVVLGINWCYHGVIEWALQDVMSESPSFTEKLRELGMTRVGLIFWICVMPAVTEEIAFRGLVQHWLQNAIRPWKAIALASFLFATVHYSPLSLPYLMLVGALLGWAKYKTNSLFPCMLIHFLHNLVVVELFW